MNLLRKSDVERLALRVGVGISLVVLAIRDYLFGTGYYFYRDWSWPLSANLSPRTAFSPSAVTNSAPDPLGFTRIFFNWPVYIFESLTNNAQLAEKAFVIYLFSMFLLLAFVFAELLLRLLSELTLTRLSILKREVFVLFVVLISFANFWSLQQLSDLYYTYISEFMLLSISVVLIFLWKANFPSIFVSAALLSFCIFLDPNLFPFEVLALSIAIGVTVLMNDFSWSSIGKGTLRIVSLIAYVLPALMTTLFLLNQTTGTGLRPVGSYLKTGGNLSLENSLRLMGYLWSLIVYAPPSILENNGTLSLLSVHGSPPYILLPPGVITSVWLATTWTLPVLAFSSLLVRKLRKVTIPAALISLAGILLTQASIFPYPFLVASQVSTIPVIGGAVTTTLAIPDHILIIVASSYLILASVSMFHVSSVRNFSLFGRDLLNSREKMRAGRLLLTVGLMFLLIFPSWQFFSGSFFPASYVEGIGGNGVPNEGAFTPSLPPPEMNYVFNWLLSQPGHFNVYWPGANGGTYPWSEKSTPSITWIDSPKPTFLTTSTIPGMFPAGLEYLVSSNLTGGVAAYLRAANVKYLVVQPTSKIGFLSSWGIADQGKLVSFLDKSPGLSLALTQATLSVYEVDSPWGSLYSPDQIYQYQADDQRYASAFSAFESMNSHISFMRSGSAERLCVDATTCSLSLLSPEFLARALPSTLTVDAINGSIGGSLSSTLVANRYTNLPDPWGAWTVSNWGLGSANVSVEPSIMRWTFDGTSTLLSLSYNGTVTNNRPGGFTIQEGQEAIATVSFLYRTSTPRDFSVQVLAPILNSDLQILDAPASPDYGASTNWSLGQYNITLPHGSRFFTFRIQAQASSGWVELSNARVSIHILNEDRSAPFGVSVPIENGMPYSLGVFSGYVYLQAEGNGQLLVSHKPVAIINDTFLSWTSQFSPTPAQFEVVGNLSLTTLIVAQEAIKKHSNVLGDATVGDGTFIQVGSAGSVVYSRMFVPGFSLTSNSHSYSPTPTVDGLNVFLNVAPGSYQVRFPSYTGIVVSYVVSLSFASGIIIMFAPPIANRVRHFLGRILARFVKSHSVAKILSSKRNVAL